MGSRIKQNPESTFEVYIEATCPVAVGTDPEVRRQFPEDYGDQEILQTVVKFCFPFYMDGLTVGQVGQNFTFVLTDIDSKQRFGFCRLSSGAKTCLCILSYLPWFEVFYKLLNVLADYTAKGQDNQRSELLQTLYKLPIPEPDTSVHLSVHTYFTVPDTTKLPSIPENRNLTEYFVAVDVNNLLHLYASLLYERRVLIFCSKLSTLTACIHACAALLYPMFWQHVYIPVLPPHLLEYCCAPMPYLIGIHLSLMEKVRNISLEDVVILNVDTNTLETPFDDLQSLPNDVVSALKNRLKKVSMTTGDGVARAFLKAQAAFFGSYRNALKIEPGEPITFCEETFVFHRSATMRQFLQNAIQLQLFKQFIDGRLDLLNSGEGFSDVFEEEINMGEYAGSDKLYHQWLSTVKKGSGAILNTVKTKANPAMKTVYKFAKDHAKMGIKEVKNRLKQKDISENGCSTLPEDALPRTAAPSPLAEKRDPRLQEDRRPITLHFGQVRPPRPQVVRRPKNNVSADGRRTSVSSPEQPQPYRALKESDSADGEEGTSPERPQGDPSTPESPAEMSLLEDIFTGLEVEPQPLSQARSLEDLRISKEEGGQQYTFDYQRMDLSFPEDCWAAPGTRLSHPSMQPCGQDDMALSSKYPHSSPERPSRAAPPVPRRPQRRDGMLDLPGQDVVTSPAAHGNITIPRPLGRKTPELAMVPPPPAPRPPKQPAEAAPCPAGPPPRPLASDFLQETLVAHTFSLDPDLRPGLTQLPSVPGTEAELLQPVKVNTSTNAEGSGTDSDALLSLLDPLKSGGAETGLQLGSCQLLGSPSPGLAASSFPSSAEDLLSFPQLLVYPPSRAPFGQPSLNPFVPAGPTPLPLSLQRPLAPSLGHASTASFLQPQRAPAHPLALSMPNLFAPPLSAPCPGQPLCQSQGPQLAQLGGPSRVQTLPLAHSASKGEARSRLAARPSHLPLASPQTKAEEPILCPAKTQLAKDPFEDLLRETKQEVGKVEQLRRQWETFD